MLQLYRSLAIFQKDKSGSVIHNLVFKINIADIDDAQFRPMDFGGKRFE